MDTYSKIQIILKDSPKHDDYNKRIIDYLNDRYMAINDNMFTIAIEVVDDSSINKYALLGMSSIPAMKVRQDEEYIYGVNSIIAQLSKLEIETSMRQSSFTPSKSQMVIEQSTDQTNSFYDMVMEEMKNNEQEDPDAPSTLKSYHQDLPEAPLTDKMIDEKTKAYDQIYEDRRRRNPSRPSRPAPKKMPPTSINVEKMIQDGGYDKGEELLMRQIVQNL